MKKGVFCLSLDLELLWGRRALTNYDKFIWRVKKERNIINKLLRLFKEYNISATWAVVGHLFLNQCSSDSGLKHPEIKRTNPMGEDDCFILDPASTIDKAPEWYGADIVEKLINTKNQEIGSHSFSHLIFDKRICPKQTADSEIKECIRLAKEKNLKLRSFVFPVNIVGHLDILKKYGFTSFRGPQPNIPIMKGFLHHQLMLIDFLLPFHSPVSLPVLEHGLVNIPASMYFFSARGRRRFVPRGMRYAKAKKGIDTAIKEKKIFHLWTHPIDLIDNEKSILEELEKILKYVSKKRDEGKINIMTMGNIAKNVIASSL